VKVSSRAHYGLRLMTELARAYRDGGARSLAEIARHEHLPQGYLEQLIMPLKRAGLVVSTRGAHGGYRLSRAPETITAGDVVRAVDEPIALVDCLCDDYQPGTCEVETDCTSRPLWARVRASINEVLDGTTLADLGAAPTELRTTGGGQATRPTAAPIQFVGR